MTTRRRAREIVVQLLYEDDLNPEQDKAVATSFLKKRLNGNKPLIEFARNLWENVLKNRWDLDKAITSKAANWSLRRMAAIDRNVLRLGAYEILHTETPGRVAINEAVELAKRYGDKLSGQFVNGILDRILHEQANPAVEEAETAAAKPGLAEVSASELPSAEDSAIAADDVDADVVDATEVDVHDGDADRVDAVSVEAEETAATSPD